MINHINKYFNPSCTVNSLGYIFDLIDVKQALDESVITLKGKPSNRVTARMHFARAFSQEMRL
jgi:hypothetical protein